MISLYRFENFLRFLLQDKHNASYFSNMSWRGTPQSKCKSNKKAAIITYLVVDLFACLNGIGGFYSFIPLPFRCGITGCRMLCRSFSNCSLNHSPMGRMSTVRMNLPMSAYLHHWLSVTIHFNRYNLCFDKYTECGDKCKPLYFIVLHIRVVPPLFSPFVECPLSDTMYWVIGYFRRYVTERLLNTKVVVFLDFCGLR